MGYQTFAQVYDRIMDETLYDQWGQFVDSQLANQKQKVLELACGTGALAVMLKKKGYSVTGLDLSSDMLSLANERALKEQVKLPLIEGNMMDLSGIGEYDAVTCFSDSICYMPDKAAVQAVFKEVYNILPEKGVFMFDVHSIYQMEKVFPGYMFNDASEEASFLWSSYAGDEKYSVEHDLTFFVYDEQTGFYERFDETHKERTYPLEEYHAMLREAGFTSVESSADFGKSVVYPDASRWFFACTK